MPRGPGAPRRAGMRSPDLLLSGSEPGLLSATLFVITQGMQITDVTGATRPAAPAAGRSAAPRVPPGTRALAARRVQVLPILHHASSAVKIILRTGASSWRRAASAAVARPSG